MKTKLITLFLLIQSFLSVAQNAPNPGMEIWVNNGMYDEPMGYYTSNFYTLLGSPLSVTKSTDKHGGFFAAKLSNVILPVGPTNDTVSAFMTIGDFNTGVDGAPFTTRPANTHFWYKYSTNQDTGSFIAIFSKWNPQTESRDIVGSAAGEVMGNISSYVQKTLPVVYFMPVNPDTLTLLIFSSVAEYPVLGTSFYLDDISFSGNVGIEESTAKVIRVYPNPAKNKLYIDSTDPEAEWIDLIDLNGKTVGSANLSGQEKAFYITGLKNGIYFYRIYNSGKRILSAGKVNVQN